MTLERKATKIGAAKVGVMILGEGNQLTSRWSGESNLLVYVPVGSVAAQLGR
jgi:hypothetical protein